jgi:hypothetical protein
LLSCRRLGRAKRQRRIHGVRTPAGATQCAYVRWSQKARFPAILGRSAAAWLSAILV